MVPVSSVSSNRPYSLSVGTGVTAAAALKVTGPDEDIVIAPNVE
jgi:hypothetical protein